MANKKVEKISKALRGATLYLVPTPIGNLRDITLRAIDVLREVDLIACEDTRHTRKLLSVHGIRKTMISYEKFSEMKKVTLIAEYLESGKSVALVSDAGTPLISDPGSVLISHIREMGVRIEALPGPNAAVTAFSASGFGGSFRFIGFFPRQKSIAEREAIRMNLSSEHTVFYESPHKIITTLKLLERVLGERTICLAREISKIHEEYILGTAGELIEQLSRREAIGEVTVIIHGSSQEEVLDENALKDRAVSLLKSGHTKKDVLRVLTEETGMGRNKIYGILLTLS